MPIECIPPDACKEAIGCDMAVGCMFIESDCDDGEECTSDGCDPFTGCFNAPVADGLPCNAGAGSCQSGECVTSGGKECDPGENVVTCGTQFGFYTIDLSDGVGYLGFHGLPNMEAEITFMVETATGPGALTGAQAYVIGPDGKCDEEVPTTLTPSPSGWEFTVGLDSLGYPQSIELAFDPAVLDPPDAQETMLMLFSTNCKLANPK